jgi:hypothetical protein
MGVRGNTTAPGTSHPDLPFVPGIHQNIPVPDLAQGNA